jgi:tyrosyl-tRNA synthetase
MEKMGMEPQVCLTLPLLEGTDGVQKMSKSYGNYIGITEEPAEMFGKVMSIPDSLMPRYLYLASTYAVDEADAIVAGLEADALHPNEVKRQLAGNIVAAYHGEEAAVEAETAFNRVFKERGLPTDIPEVALELVPNEEGLVYVPGVLVELGLVASNGEARRLIDGGGVKVAGEALATGSYTVEPACLQGQVIQVGKRKYARINPPQ